MVEVLIILAGIGWAIAIAVTGMARDAERARVRALSEETLRKGEAARYELKLASFLRDWCEAEGWRSLLKPRMAETVIYQNHEAILSEWPEQIAGYKKWKADPDYPRMVTDSGDSSLADVWEARCRALDTARTLTEADIESWEHKNIVRYQEATPLAMTVAELERERRKKTGREKRGEGDGAEA